MFCTIWELALSVDSTVLSGNSQKVQRRLGIPRKCSVFWEFPDGTALSGKLRLSGGTCCHTRQSNYTQHEATVYQYTPGSLSRVIAECVKEEALQW